MVCISYKYLYSSGQTLNASCCSADLRTKCPCAGTNRGTVADVLHRGIPLSVTITHDTAAKGHTPLCHHNL